MTTKRIGTGPRLAAALAGLAGVQSSIERMADYFKITGASAMHVFARPLYAGMTGYRSPRVVFDGGAGTQDFKQFSDLLTTLQGQVKQVGDDLKSNGERLQTEIKNLGTATTETKQTVDKALTDFNVLKGQVQTMEQVVARLEQGGGGSQAATTPGQDVVNDDKFKAFVQNKAKGRVSIDVKQATITSLTTDAAGSAGALVVRERVPGVIIPAMRRMTIRDLLMPGRTNSNLIEYVREKLWTDGTEIQATEGASKGQSDLQYELKQSPVRTVAAYVRASKQILDDAAQLMSLIDQRLRYGLMLAEEDQLLNGDGNGVNLSGLIDNSTAYAAAFTPSLPTQIDTIRLAMLQAALAEWPATGVILHPTDWARIELTKDEEGRYIFANPQSTASPTMWGQPVVATQAMEVDKFLAGAFVPAAQIFDRQDPTVEVSTEDQDNFIKNLVTIRAEQRLTVVVYRPEALIYGDFGNES